MMITAVYFYRGLLDCRGGLLLFAGKRRGERGRGDGDWLRSSVPHHVIICQATDLPCYLPASLTPSCVRYRVRMLYVCARRLRSQLFLYFFEETYFLGVRNAAAVPVLAVVRTWFLLFLFRCRTMVISCGDPTIVFVFINLLNKFVHSFIQERLFGQQENKKRAATRKPQPSVWSKDGLID